MKNENVNPSWWIFTFGQDQVNSGYYIKIFGTYSDARLWMTPTSLSETIPSSDRM